MSIITTTHLNRRQINNVHNQDMHENAVGWTRVFWGVIPQKCYITYAIPSKMLLKSFHLVLKLIRGKSQVR